MPKRKRVTKRKRKKFPYGGCNFASNAEREFAKDLDKKKIWWLYEPEQLEWYPPPPTRRLYKPDYKIKKKNGNYFFVEFKGYFRKGNKQKMRAVKLQNPAADIRFIFMDASKPCSKHVRKDGTRMSHAEWAEKYDFLWAEGSIPEEWLNEI